MMLLYSHILSLLCHCAHRLRWTSRLSVQQANKWIALACLLQKQLAATGAGNSSCTCCAREAQTQTCGGRAHLGCHWTAAGVVMLLPQLLLLRVWWRVQATVLGAQVQRLLPKALLDHTVTAGKQRPSQHPWGQAAAAATVTAAAKLMQAASVGQATATAGLRALEVYWGHWQRFLACLQAAMLSGKADPAALFVLQSEYGP